MKSRSLVLGAVLLAPAIASAEHPMQVVDQPGNAPEYGFVADQTTPDGIVFARQVLPAGTTTIAALAQSRIIYLNHTGVTLRPGDNDSRQNLSTIVTAQTSIPAWTTSAQSWTDTVSCFRDLFSRFDVSVVDTDPGNVPHIEAVFGGTPTQVGLPSNVGGVSPFTTDCSIIENSIVFTFTAAIPNITPRMACEIMAQEVAHSYGLDHELLASDPMTYLSYNGNRAFQDQAASCGESTARVCGINGSQCRQNQNSVALLLERVGAVGDAVAPTMAWASPSDGATVPPGFDVKASGQDNIAVTGATLKIDGTQVDAKTGAGPFTFTTSATLAEGAHTLIVEVSDGKNVQSQTRSVTVKKGATPPDGGSGSSGGDSALDNGDIVGGCAAGGGGGGGSLFLALGIFVAAYVRRRA